MYENVINGIKSLIKERSKDIDRLNLDWFGGEPLLAFDIVDDIMKYARKCADVSGLTLTSGMTTNASLFTKTKQEELIRLGVTKFQITLDGDTELHNSLRVTRNNTSTFNIIYNNLIDFHRSSLDGKIIIRLHVNRYNLSSMKSLINKISQDFKDDERISLLIRELERLGGSNDEKLPVIDDEIMRNRLIKELQEEALDFGLKLYNPHNELPVCYAATFGSYAIRATGEVSKCTVALYDQRNIIGHLSEDGKLNIDKEKLTYWVRGQFTHNNMELLCPYRSEKNNLLSKEMS